MKAKKQAIWLGDSLKNLRSFPESVKDQIGYELYLVQNGKIPNNAKVLKGFKPTVIEIISDYDKNTYRTVYTVKISETVYILHCFQKKSKSGLKTPKQELELIKQRLKKALTIGKTLEVLEL